MDISAAYAKGVSDALGNAQVVYDKFHIIQNVVTACDQVRKAENRAENEKRDLSERVVPKPGDLEGKTSPEVGVDGPETMSDGHGLPDEACA